MHDWFGDGAAEDKLRITLRANAVLLGLVSFLFLVLIVCYVCEAPQSSWNDARLAPLAAWVRGFPLYTPEHTGVLIGNYYPPLGALAYLPAGLFGRPLPAIISGSILAFLMNLSPALGALVLWSRGLHGRYTLVLLGSVLYVGLLLITPGPNFTLFAIHVDAPAIALMLWGVVLYAQWWASRRRWSLAASAFLLGSAVWAKQLGVPLPVAFLLATYLIGGFRPAIGFVGWSLVTQCFWLAVLTPIIGDWRAFIYYILIVPADQHWIGQLAGGGLEKLKLLAAESMTFLRQYWLFYLLTLSITIGLNICAGQSGDRSLRLSFTLAASSLIAALTMFPFSLLGLVKVGGNINASAFTIQPLLFGLVIGGLGLLVVARRASVQWHVLAQVVVGACLLIYIAALRPGGKILSYPFEISSAPVVTAYQESKGGHFWFPEFPLAMLLATGRIYHHAYSVHAIYLAGDTVPPRQLAEGIPETPFTLKYLAGNSEGVEAASMLALLGLGSIVPEKKGRWRQVLVQDYRLR